MKDVKHMFVGTWRLISCTQSDEMGNKTLPWGENAIGYLIYTEENIMSVQIMRRDRKLFSKDDFRKATASECARIRKDYNAYFGSYTIDVTKQTVTHHMEGNLFPNLIGEDNVRHFRFVNNRLLLTVIGLDFKRDLIWERLK